MLFPPILLASLGSRLSSFLFVLRVLQVPSVVRVGRQRLLVSAHEDYAQGHVFTGTGVYSGRKCVKSLFCLSCRATRQYNSVLGPK